MFLSLLCFFLCNGCLALSISCSISFAFTGRNGVGNGRRIKQAVLLSMSVALCLSRVSHWLFAEFLSSPQYSPLQRNCVHEQLQTTTRKKAFQNVVS